MAGEISGGRNEYIYWTQDLPDQSNRASIHAILLRALQFAMCSAQGPVYLIASRETLCEEFEEAATQSGRSAQGFEALRTLAEVLAIAVHENAPIYNNFPATSFLRRGHQWNGSGQLPALAEADVVLVIGADVPWIPAQSKPSPRARMFHLDSDPLKERTTLWSIPCERRRKCDSALALQQLGASVRASSMPGQAKTLLHERFNQKRNGWLSVEVPRQDGRVTVLYFMSRLREATVDLRVVGLNESTTNLGNIDDHLRHNITLALIDSGGASLG
ncbi:hypothetical protein AAE478_005119 [Parahypoxylon ruwenzoriense]